MTDKLKPCPFCGSEGATYTFRFKMLCSECGSEGPRGRDAQECEERWNQRREWVPFREAGDMPEFRYGIRYPAKFPTASEPHRYGWVEANKKDDGRMFYYVNGWHKQTLDTRADNLWGEPIVGDVLVLVSALEEYADQEDER
ncbi:MULTISPECIES: hypothetical protein [unclassified Saccharibacter]|uniref:hypothetical protein n=1 Tax=unclassified Saccharibacter TaxID=2648722 RepID=UPI0013216A03|nr:MULTISPECIES: hypothetical protein [unclassified Saccharibacter]MXV35541.1 hypothetical protein [Saccharibacter sp. EH611]MXV58202.1 hypothetical protein [Saccharibacter sp. EH70]MXV65475.1 hypothetical protein [Saccharibacter sp. EH60]